MHIQLQYNVLQLLTTHHKEAMFSMRTTLPLKADILTSVPSSRVAPNSLKVGVAMVAEIIYKIRIYCIYYDHIHQMIPILLGRWLVKKKQGIFLILGLVAVQEVCLESKVLDL
jgi:hypothetical protein